ncbi:heat shock transcription factor [Medicago truncatula]|uniref:Heat shock transcription factor n=1 Tax=Medicago truncatula TaxID=3880 RepID=G7JY56_MEDTR|nr:heat shock transcription factor [Medicago truncatula]
MVEDSLIDSIISWSANGRSFIISNSFDLAKDSLPRYFKHNNFSSGRLIRLVRRGMRTGQGFRKVDSEKWEFANNNFVKVQPYLMKNIHMQKSFHRHSL